ncbi:MAG: hypothetical protein M1828_002026 [Chrysothrix sp. TS-e1954]|nr:MAG: hypothetical protein M1828_002026 [Chrysothrix sp. TS-e1954]
MLRRMADLTTLNEIPTLTSLYRNSHLRAPPSPTSFTPNKTFNDKIAIIRTDITKLQVDSIVNAANESLLGGGGVDGAIHRAAGEELVEECETLDGCDTGSAKITDAYRLPCKKVVHAVGPVYSTTKRRGEHTSLLQGCYRTSLELAVKNNLKSIAFSALSTGVYGYPSLEAAQTATEEVRTFLESGKGDSLTSIIFCNFMEKDEKAYKEVLPKIFPPTEEGEADGTKDDSERSRDKPFIPGDGIGTEITEAAIQVLETLASAAGTFSFHFEHFDWSSQKYQQTGRYKPDDWLEQLKRHDAIYFGAVGWPDVPDHISLWQLILPIRNHLNQYVNVRPTRILRGTTSPLASCATKPSILDWSIVRENSEGEYSGHGGTTHPHSPHTVATEVSIFTRAGCERIFRFAFDTALSRPRKKLTMVTKSNAQRHGMVLWDSIFEEIKLEYKDSGVEVDKMLVDAMTVRMVQKPETIDTVVATNLHADILTDLAAALSGSIGIAPSSNLDPTRENPSMFEPIHGSAPDIAGKGVANPVGAFWSAAEMVRWLAGADGAAGSDARSTAPESMGMIGAADKLMEAIERVTERGIKTADLGGKSKTKEVTEAVCSELGALYTKA